MSKKIAEAYEKKFGLKAKVARNPRNAYHLLETLYTEIFSNNTQQETIKATHMISNQWVLGQKATFFYAEVSLFH